MAVTVQAQPATHTPVYNPQWFQATSTQTAQPNFRYRVVFTDLISGGTSTEDFDGDISGVCIFDAGGFSEQYMTQINPSGLYGWQRNTGAIRKIRVNIGEVYGSTPTYYAGANTDYIVWNASLDTLSNEVYDMQNYNVNTYKYSQGNNIQIITNNRNPLYTWSPSSDPQHYSMPETVTANRSSYLYFLSDAAGDVQRITVTGFLNNGIAVATTTITNPFQAGTTYTDKYVFIDVGYDGLANVPAGQCSGTFPIPVATYDYWIVYDTSAWLPASTPPAADYIYPLKRFNMVCEGRYDIVTIHYLSPQGSFETQPCTKLSLRKSTSQKSYYSKLPYVSTGYVMGYPYGVAVENTLSSSRKDSITVNTDWLTEQEITQLKNAIDSAVILVDFGNSRGYLSMKMVTNSYEETKDYNKQMAFATFDLDFNISNTRQKG